jgi:hypothetical protein
MTTPHHLAGNGSLRHRGKDGFALLITITLLAFLVMLLVSLAALTRVETQVASNSQQSAQARQNALMALNIALGELQKYAGPDQRVTARSDIDATLATTTTQSGRWIAAYGRGVAAGDTITRDLYADIPSQIEANIAANSDANGNQSVRLNWLVSGNEKTDFDPATAVDANGQIERGEAPTAFAYAATDPVANLAGSDARSTDITIKTKPARLLVGPGSVSALSDYVAAPLVDIAVDSATVPGAGTSGSDVTVGRYAWWVGDEGAKARLNLPLTTDASVKPLAFVSAQRAAIELMDGVHPEGSTAPFATTDLIGSAYNPTHANLTAVMNKTQLPLLTPANAATLAAAVKNRFHDLSAYSISVLSDTYAGGLKKDLSAVLAPLSATGLTSPADTDYLFAPEPDSAGDPTNEFGMPTWGVLRSFVKTTAPASGGLASSPPAMTTVAGRPVPVPTSMGVSPVVSYATLGFQYAAPNGDVSGQPIRLAVFPIVVLWNPYTTDLQPAKYEFGLRRAFDAFVQLQAHAPPYDAAYAWSAADVLETRDLGKEGKTGSGANSYFRFIIDNSNGIPAGQSVVFTLQTSGADYVANDPANMLTAASYNPLGHVLIPSSLTVTTPGSTYRVAVNGRSGGTPVTTFGLPARTNMGGTDGGWHEAYLGAFGVNPPTASKPFTGTTTFTSQEWYQQLSITNAPYTSVSPYVAAGGGYAVSRVNTGLIQDEGTLSPIVTAPTFRIVLRALFSKAERTEYSTRWIAQSNPRALVVGGVPTSSNNGIPSLYTGRPPESGSTWPYGLSIQGTRTSSGTSLQDSSGPVDTTLFEFRPDTEPLMALGQLQHANVAWHNAYPSYAIGNSIGDPQFTTPQSVLKLTGGRTVNEPSKLTTAYYDLSWLLNRNLWDKYFVSTVPHTDTGITTTGAADSELTSIPAVLPNPRHLFHEAKPTDPDIRTKLNADQAASHLLLSGGFNINSTSEQAWRAVLGGLNQLAYEPTGSSTGGSASNDSVLPRFARPTTNSGANAWQGYRKLTPAQIADLAKNIVTQIRKRGPFVSMADFINRRLIQSGAFPQSDDSRLKGAIQAALDATSTGSAAINTAAAPFDTVVLDSFNRAVTNAFKTGSSAAGAATSTAPTGSPAVFAPQYLTQADVLSAIGGGLSARSDTFTIRTYGESVTPADSTIVTGRAWCEAVVQRLPEYADMSADPDAYDTPTATINKTMGRRFKIISFRWLTSNDI